MTEIVEEIAANVARFTAALGDGITDLQGKAARRAAELVALADRYRARALDGEAIDLGQLMTLENAAEHAVTELRLPAPKAAGDVKVMEIRFVGNYTAGLTDEEHRLLDELGKRIAGLDPDTEAKTAEEALLLVERLRQENDELRVKLADAEKRVAPVPDQSCEVLPFRPPSERSEYTPHPPHPVRALPAPSGSIEAMCAGYVATVGSGRGPYLVPDVLDKNGRRLDPDTGLPASRRQP
jgi:hypothetical protein